MKSGTGPWFRAATFQDGLLIPARPRGRAFDLLLQPEEAALRGPGRLALPWSEHLDFAGCIAASHGWNIVGWGGQAADRGAGIHLRGDLDVRSQSLPLMRSWLVRWNRTPNWGSVAPLHRQSKSLFSHYADVEVIHALCTVLTRRPDLRSRLAEGERVRSLIAEVVSSPHARRGDEQGAKRLTVETISALRGLGYTHPIGGRPLPGERVPTAEELLPKVLTRIQQNPYAARVKVTEGDVEGVIQRAYSGAPPWPFEALLA